MEFLKEWKLKREQNKEKKRVKYLMSEIDYICEYIEDKEHWYLRSVRNEPESKTIRIKENINKNIDLWNTYKDEIKNSIFLSSADRDVLKLLWRCEKYFFDN